MGEIDADVMERARDCWITVPAQVPHFASEEECLRAIARAIQAAKDEERERCLSEADHFLNDIQISVQGRSRFDIYDLNREAKKAVRYVRDRISGEYANNWTEVSKGEAERAH